MIISILNSICYISKELHKNFYFHSKSIDMETFENNFMKLKEYVEETFNTISERF